MAKPTILKLAFVIALSMAAVSAATAAVGTFTGATSLGGTSFSASNKVTVWAVSDGTNSTTYNGTVYSIRSAHSGGDKCIAAVSNIPKLFFATAAAGSASTIGSAPATTDNYSASGSTATWTSM